MNEYFKHNWLSLIIIFSGLSFGLYLMPELPEQLPAHWDIHGNVDRYWSKSSGVFILPLTALAVTMLIQFLLNRSPESFQMNNSRRSVGKINLAMTLLVIVLHVGILLMGKDPQSYSFEPFFYLASGLFLILGGNFMGKLERNFFIGIRVPWTLTSDKNWVATHRFAAKTMVIGGVILLATSVLKQSMAFAVAVFIVSILGPVFYSYWFFKKNESQNHVSV